MKKQLSLREVPRALFRELSMFDTPQQVGTFSKTGGDCTVSVCIAQEPGPSGPYTLVHEDHRCDSYRMHRTLLGVYPYLVMAEEFDPGFEGFKNPSILQIAFWADDPPYNPTRAVWQKGKGYWVDERLTVSYGLHQPQVIAGPSPDWEFGFLLRIQGRASMLAREIGLRGHWQCDWDPKRDYSREWRP